MSEQTVKCPGCGKTVTPRAAPPTKPPAAPSGTTASGARWSFAWRPPSGSVCPECLFPLERYQRRRPWVRLFRVGVAFATAAVLVQLGLQFGMLPASLGVLTWIGAGMGVLGIAIGGGGMLLGGRHAADGTP